MKTTLILALTTILSAALLIGCEHRRLPEKETLHCYRTHADNNNSGDWIYWYVIIMMNNANSPSYSYASSPTPTTAYSSLKWSSSSTLPKEITEATPEENLGTKEIETTELGEAEIDSLDSMEGIEPGTEPSSIEPESSVESGGDVDAGGDAGADAGGGDAGGGDGGE